MISSGSTGSRATFSNISTGRPNKSITVPGSPEVICLGDDWQSRALSAYWRAVKACGYERDNQIAGAGDEWQKIFGQQIPRTVRPPRGRKTLSMNPNGRKRPVLIPRHAFLNG